MGEMGLSLARYIGCQIDLLCDFERPEVAGGHARISAQEGKGRCSVQEFEERAERTKGSPRQKEKARA